MFNIECIIYLIILLYSAFYGIYVVVLYNQNKKIEIKNGNGLYVSKDILNKNDLKTLYVTKINGKYNDHYDIERNVIRLSDEVYDKTTLSSLVIAMYQALKAITTDSKKRKEKKLLYRIVDYSTKICFILFIIGVATKSLDIMTIALVIIMMGIIFKYNEMIKLSEQVEENIKYLKKEYKLKDKDVESVEKIINALLHNELALHIFINKY